MVRYQFGPFCLVPEQRLLENSGVPVAVTAKALDLLVLLVRHRTRALSKEDLLAALWPGVSVEEGNLTQQIYLLRQTLRDIAPCVATVPRHGYRFVAPVVESSDSSGPADASPHCLLWEGRVFALRDGITVIGRADDVDIQLLLPSVSRHHARLVTRGPAVTIEDLGSRHGTWRGATRLSGVSSLASRDEIRIGTAVLLYRLVRPLDTTV